MADSRDASSPSSTGDPQAGSTAPLAVRLAEIGTDLASVQRAVAATMPGVVTDLERLVAIPSCAFPGFPDAPVHQAAAATVELLRRSGLEQAQLVDVPGGYPMVYGRAPAPPGAPTVLLYAHYDVQPAPADQGVWHSDPWTPTRRDGRLYGRGAADDKSGVVLHAGTLQVVRSLTGAGWPVGLVVVVEGEEETDSHLGQLVHEQPQLFDADVYVVADGGNERVGLPVLEVTTRGVVQLGLEVSTLRAPVHSGLFGGAAPDALIALIRMVATLHDDVGNVAVTGLHQYPWPGDDTDHEVFRRAAGIQTGVELVGDGSLASRLWSRPAISVIGIDAPPTQGAVNALVPQARATISMRVAPGADPEVEARLLRDHLRAVAPWGVHVSMTQGQLGPSWATGTDGPALALAREAMSAAFGAEPELIGSGGAIPLLSALQQVNPHAEFVLWGAEDGAAANIHSANESVDLAELERALLASCLLLLGLAAPTTPGS